jgi:hypothetical protein
LAGLSVVGLTQGNKALGGQELPRHGLEEAWSAMNSQAAESWAAKAAEMALYALGDFGIYRVAPIGVVSRTIGDGSTDYGVQFDNGNAVWSQELLEQIVRQRPAVIPDDDA